MTLPEMAKEYRRQEDRFRVRILELKQARKTATDRQRFYLDRRINELTALRRETREVAAVLEHYYERGFYKNGKYAL